MGMGKWFLRLAVSVAVLLLVVLGIVFVSPLFFQPSSEIQRFTRGPDGGVSRLEQNGIYLSALRSNAESVSSSNSSFCGTPGGFTSSRSALVLVDSDHPLLRYLGPEFVRALLKEGPFENIILSPYGAAPLEGERSPDWFIRINVYSIVKRGLLTRNIECRIAVSFGQSPCLSNFANTEQGQLEMSHSTFIDFSQKIQMLGFTNNLPLDFARQVTPDIAKQIRDKVLEVAKDTRPAPEVPESLYATDKSSPTLRIPGIERFRLVGSFSQPFMHNVTYWECDSLPDVAAFLRETEGTMKKDGWSTTSADLDAKESPYLSMNHGQFELCAFVKGKVNALNASGSAANTERDMCISFSRRFSPQEIKAAFEKLMESKPPLDLLRYTTPVFEGVDESLKQTLRERVKVEHPTDYRTLLNLARMSLPRKEEAFEYLQMAALSASASNMDVKTDLETIGKQCAPAEWEPETPVSPGIADKLGYVDLKMITLPYEHEVEPGKPFALYYTDASGALTLLGVSIIAGTGNPVNHDILLTESRPGNGNSMCRTSGNAFNHTAALPDRSDAMLAIDGVRQENGKFRVQYREAPLTQR